MVNCTAFLCWKFIDGDKKYDFDVFGLKQKVHFSAEKGYEDSL